MLAQYWGLAAAFVIVVIAVSVYFYKLPRTPLYIEPATVPVYIDAIAPKGTTADQSAAPPVEPNPASATKPSPRPPPAPAHR